MVVYHTQEMVYVTEDQPGGWNPRSGEYQVVEACNQKLCHAPIYLGVGQEACAATVSTDLRTQIRWLL